ncbi:hypothetical protein, partial [Malaciobacter pacificus]
VISGDGTVFDNVSFQLNTGESSTTYETTIAVSVSQNDTDGSETITSVVIKVENLPEDAVITQNGVEITPVDGTYTLDTSDLSDVKITSSTELVSDGDGGLKISVEATSTESNGGEEAIQTAVLVDGIVEGIYYETSSGLSGYTDENGNFNFRAGDDVIFSVGGVTLGTATASDIASGQTFLQDIADVDRTDLNDEYLENMAVFLQSIDTADSGDNIVITQAMHDALADVNIDLTTASEEDIKSLIESIGGTYVDEDDAMSHVQEMLEEYAGMEASEFDERVEDDEDIISATLGKEPQSGIEYTTSSGISGITGEDGIFEYNDGDEITFMQNGEVLSTIDSSAIGNDSMITFNELETLNQTEIDFDDLELDFDNLSEILDSEDNTVFEKDIDEETELSIGDMLTSDEVDESLSNLLGETEEDKNITKLDELKTEDTTNESTDSSGEYCPFKVLEESSSNLIANIEIDDSIQTDDN